MAIILVSLDYGVSMAAWIMWVGISLYLTVASFIGGLDYVGGVFSVSFSFDTDPTQCFNVTILNDDERETEKSFVVDFDLSSFPDSRIMLGASTNVTVVIIGRYPKYWDKKNGGLFTYIDLYRDIKMTSVIRTPLYPQWKPP